MRLNRRGDIGFPEAMMAVMIVTVVLMAYLGVFAAGAADRTDAAPEFDRRITAGARIASGELILDAEDRMAGFIEKNGCRGLTVRCSIPGNSWVETAEFFSGTLDGRISGEKYTQSIKSDEGRIFTAVFEVGIWY